MTTDTTSGTSELRDIPLSKLVPSPANVRRTACDAGIEPLAASLAAHGLLQSLSVRPVHDDGGQETGTYEVVAGGRRLAALRLLAKRKQMAKSAPVPCLVQAAGEAEELSLAENVVREPLHRPTSSRRFGGCTRRTGWGLRRSPRASASPQRWCASGCGWGPRARCCWRVTARVPSTSTS